MANTICETNFENRVNLAIDKDIDSNRYENSPYYNEVMSYIQKYRDSSVASAIISEADQSLLIENTSALNLSVKLSIAAIPTFSKDYPYIYERLQLTPFITPAETQTFITNFLYNSNVFSSTLGTYNYNFLTNLDTYFGPTNFSRSGMASFCSLVPNIFAQFTALKDAFRQIESFVADFTSLISDIQDFSLAGLLEALKKQALAVVDQIVARVKARIAQFTSFFTQISNFSWNHNAIYSKVMNQKSRIQALVSDPSVGNLKLALEGSISFAASLFEELRIEEIQFLILRFCELISNLENFYNDVTRPLQDTMDNYTNSFSILSGAGSYRSARAIAAGALRFNSEQRYDGMTQAASVVASPYEFAGVGVEGIVPGGGAIRQRSARANPITAQESDEASLHMTYESVLEGSSPYIYYRPGPASASGGRYGWDNVQPLEKIMLMRLAKTLGVKLIINSAWRSLETQARIRGNDDSIPRSGYHQSGQAFDVSRSGMPSENSFINTARSLGFGGIGRYNSFIHIDSRYGDVTFR